MSLQKKFVVLFAFLSLFVGFASQNTLLAQLDFQATDNFTRQDKLRGAITPEREWWDLQHYDLSVAVMPKTKSIEGSNKIDFTVLKPGKRMQIDLQEPLEIRRVLFEGSELLFEREGNVYWVDFEEELEAGSEQAVTVFYGGEPVESKRPPWSGGVTWNKDEKGNDFIATTCQGIGASIWWPCKDHGYDEPDTGMDIRITVPSNLVAVSNGRLEETTVNEEDKTKTFHWNVTQPINNYCVNANIGNYVNFKDSFDGENGELDLDYWVLEHQRDKAIEHFKEVPRTIKAFEHWFGPYPFYEDSFKIVVVPYLGMEHQSSVTYGNGFQNGYRGTDLSATGVGMKFDFIIVHESGHEWFGNNISMIDAADMWIHESFTNYSENLFVEYHFTKEEGHDYVIGCRKRIQNDIPIIGVYGVNNEGSGDMYYKGGNMLHTLRHMIDNDEKWREILRGLNKDFWHQTVTTEQVENYISEQAGMDFEAFFTQYLRSTKIPVLAYRTQGNQLTYWFEEVEFDFNYPVKTTVNGESKTLKPSVNKQTFTLDQEIESFELDRNWYMELRKADDE